MMTLYYLEQAGITRGARVRVATVAGTIVAGPLRDVCVRHTSHGPDLEALLVDAADGHPPTVIPWHAVATIAALNSPLHPSG